MDWDLILKTLFGTGGIGLSVVLIIKMVLTFFESKLKPKLELILKEWLPEKMFSALQNTYQTFVKKLTIDDKNENQNWIDEALDESYQNLLNVMPKYIRNIIKRLNVTDMEKYLKQELQNYYEKYKSKINKDSEVIL